jgi:DNA-binding transcriptional regulator LsrR (DeoR family)
MYRLAEKTGAAAFVMPVPFFANTVEDREVLLAQRGVTDVLNLAAQADLMIVGIGTPEPDGLLVATQIIDAAEIEEVKRLGGVGEILGHFFSVDGNPIEAAISARTVSLELDRIKGRRIVAIAGGKEKTCAIRSLLMSHFLNGLITDERTAFALLDESPRLAG